MLDHLKRWSGWLGLGFLLLASIIYGVEGVANAGLWVPLGLSLLALGYFLSQNFEQVVNSLASRKTRLGANSVFLVLAAVTISALILAIVNNHDASLDLTKNKLHTLSDETTKVVQGLDQPVHVFAFYEPNGSGQQEFEDLLSRVRALNPGKFSYEFVNLNKKPMLAQQYSVRSYGTSVFVAGDPDSPQARNETINTPKEEDLVNALLKLSSSGSKVIYMLGGHGEVSLEDSGPSGASELKKAFGNANFELRELNLAVAGSVSNDAAALIIAGPKVDYVQPEVQLLKLWLGNGGRMIVALDPRINLPNLKGMVEQSGIVLGNDIVVDPIMRIFGNDPIAPIASTFDTEHPITKDMHPGQQQLVFPLTQSVGLKEKLPDGAGGAVLATSNPTAWAYRGSGNRIPGKPGPGDQAGPIKLAAAVEGTGNLYAPGVAGSKDFRLVVFGTSHLLSNDGIGLYNNQDIGINSARWLADDEKRISIEAKEAESQPLILDRGRMFLIGIILLLLPLGIAFLGLVVVLRRRQAL
jgi:hypothetical protein